MKVAAKCGACKAELLYIHRRTAYKVFVKSSSCNRGGSRILWLCDKTCFLGLVDSYPLNTKIIILKRPNDEKAVDYRPVVNPSERG